MRSKMRTKTESGSTYLPASTKPAVTHFQSTSRREGHRMPKLPVAVAATVISFCTSASAQLPPPTDHVKDAFPAQKHYSPYAGRSYPTRVFWGDTHLHTGNSLDAGAFGARLLPEDAHRFARGEELTSSTGLKV